MGAFPLKTHRTYQLRVYTSKAGFQRLEEVLGHTRRLYNGALEHRKTAYKQAGDSISFAVQNRELTLIRQDDPNGVGSFNRRLATDTLKRLDLAFAAFFRRVKSGETPGYPRFKGANRFRTLFSRHVEKAWLKPGRLTINGLPILRLKKGREWPDGKPLSLTITKRGRRVFVNLTCAVDIAPLPTTRQAVGVDMGITDRLTLSNGQRIKRRKRPRQARILRMQHRLSASKKGSRTRRKRAAILANHRHRERIANRNEIHRMTTAIVRRYGLIAIEDLAIKNMVKSAAGTVDNPGTNVTAKRGLNRSIQEQTWGMIRQQLEYKAESAGRIVIAVNPAHTSQRCSACGLVEATNRRGKTYACRSCGVIQDADVNAAKNILRAADTIAAGGGLQPSEIRA